MSQKDRNALLDWAANLGSAKDNGRLGPLVKLVFKRDFGVFEFAGVEIAGLLGG